MLTEPDTKDRLFDQWPDKYDQWFETPIGILVKKYENELLLDLLRPRPGELILDVGCGTGVFTQSIVGRGSHVTGLEISHSMLKRAMQKMEGHPFRGVIGNMLFLPFADGCFDKVVSMTTIEFVEDGKTAVTELLRVIKRGGIVVVTTLNNLSPWASRRKKAAARGHALFEKVIFRTPDDMHALAPINGIVKTAIHFQKDDDPKTVPEIERKGQSMALETGAFLAAKWLKP
jgi:ubiquinone/menaquinone biosynthesis C-methylase UbiE